MTDLPARHGGALIWLPLALLVAPSAIAFWFNAAGLPADRSIGMSRARMAAVSAVQADSHETHERPLPHA